MSHLMLGLPPKTTGQHHSWCLMTGTAVSSLCNTIYPIHSSTAQLTDFSSPHSQQPWAEYEQTWKQNGSTQGRTSPEQVLTLLLGQLVWEIHFECSPSML